MLRKLLYGNRYCTVEHSEDSQGDIIFYCLVLEKKDNVFEIVSTTEFTAYDDLILFLKKQHHVFIIINTSQILTKITEDVKIISSEKSLFGSLFSLDKKDFCVTSYKGDRYGFCSIARKGYVTSLLDKYKRKGVPVLGYSIGGWNVVDLFSISPNQLIRLREYEFQIQGGEVIGVTTGIFSSKEQVVNGISVSSDYVLCLSSIIDSYREGAKRNLVDVWNTKGVLGEFFQRRLTRLIVKVSLFSLLILFIFFVGIVWYYDSKISQVESKVVTYNLTSDKLAKVKAEVIEKQYMQSRVCNSFTNKAWTITKLVEDMPSSVMLQSLEICPLLRPLKDGALLEVENRILIVVGESFIFTQFSEWIAILKEQEWIKKVEVEEIFEENHKKKFRLKIQVIDEL